MKKQSVLILILLILFSSIAIAGVTKIATYNPFGRHLQWLSVGIDNALTKDIIWESTGTSTTVNTTFGGTTNVSDLSIIFLVDYFQHVHQDISEAFFMYFVQIEIFLLQLLHLHLL